MMTWVGLCLSLVLAVISVPFLVLYNLSEGLSFGRSFLLFKLMVAFTLVLLTLDGNVGSLLAELVKDGDLIGRMFRLRGLDTVRINKVKGHVDEGMVRDGGVREQDRLGNNAADGAADFGRRRVDLPVIDARRIFSGVCSRWYPVLLDLHRFLIAISRTVVNYDGNGGTSPDPLVWSSGALPKRRRLVHAVRDRALLPGPPSIWDSDWINVPASAIGADDVPFGPGIDI